MNDFGRTTLPYCSFLRPGDTAPRVGVGVGTGLLDLTGAAATIVPQHAELFAQGSLDPLLAAGPGVWAAVRAALTAAAGEQPLLRLDDVQLVLPFTVADYVDFYASEHHATNLGRMFRPDGEALMPNWKHLPVGYHGRAGTVVVSGTPVRRPSGQVRGGDEIRFGPSTRLDIEAEVGFVVGAGTALGEPVPVGDFDQHVFGICVVNDWSARDIQAWEYVPLGPFLGKSFATSVSPWIVPLAALHGARVEPPERDVELLPYLRDAEPWGLDLELVVTSERRADLPAAVRDDVLDGGPDAGPHDRQRRLAATGRPVRLGHRQRAGRRSAWFAHRDVVERGRAVAAGRRHVPVVPARRRPGVDQRDSATVRRGTTLAGPGRRRGDRVMRSR